MRNIVTFETTHVWETRALKQRKLRQGYGIRIWFSGLIRMSAGSLPKCNGFIFLSASVISPNMR